ncbi:hypothetical protein CSC2_19130 [Clostridium zeae]|uniref:N-acetyltransferase domain-containing protein n=1 Tax=Clostridium zeae TaxID=2759022 RepID=A0ABQ1E9B0_9CLOT|nr:GNAT family N-acetyltransferase [Clostridium zeae]GFZ31387.1 hypothetical protein CSC2_19130 [Clostridium zeae]
MIKNYLQLSEEDQKEAYKFLTNDKSIYTNLAYMDKDLKSDLFGFGEGVLFCVEDCNITGAIKIILKECPIKAITYAIYLSISPTCSKTTNIILKELIEASKKLVLKHNAKEFYLATLDDKLINSLNTLNYFEQYSALKMTLDSREITIPTLALIPLSEENKKQYLDINNDAFSEAPNGSTLYANEVDEYIKKADDNNCYFIVKQNGHEIGFLLFEIKDGKALFDLGLRKAFRGKGYGKMLLETAIDFLDKKQVEEIGLIVITKNTLAYNMYIKRGFKKQRVLSKWFQII